MVWTDEVEQRLFGWLEDVLYANSSVKEELHKDIEMLLRSIGTERLDAERIVMKETRSLVLKMLWQSDQLKDVVKLIATPTDILRLFAALTDSDISLATPIRFPKLSRSQRRCVLQALENSSELAEDLKRYRGLWLQVARYIHPGEYKHVYVKTAKAFDQLYRGKVQTFASITEALMRKSQAEKVLAHLSRRPGVLGRKVHELLRRFPGSTAEVISAFGDVANEMTIKNLLVLKAYFSTINELPFRTVINKKGKIKVLPNNAAKMLTPVQQNGMLEVIDHALRRQIGQKESWEGKTVWIDPLLSKITVPLQQRTASDGLMTIGRGSRIPVELDRVLRLFVYWKEEKSRTDLDLSVIQFDEDYKYIDHVSYTNLSSEGIVHSGDLQSAPHGAAEFVDITLRRVKPNVRFLATQVYRYAGDAFAEMQCHTGWMFRSKVDKSYKSFDIKTVANKLDMNGTGGYCVPLVIDLKQAEFIVTDLYMGSKAFHNNVEGAHGNVAMAIREIARFTQTRPTMDTLARLHVEAREGQLSDDKSADITFGLSGCSFNAYDIEGVLSKLL